MLKLTLKPGDAEKVLEAAAKGYSRVVEESVRAGYLAVYFYPSPDAAVAAAFTAAAAFYYGSRPVLKARPKPPTAVDGPSVILGYPALQLRAAAYPYPVLAVSAGQLSGSPPAGAVFLESEGSVTATMLAIVLTAGVRPPRDVVAAAFSGVYAGGFVSPHGRFSGVDRLLLDMLQGSGFEVDMVTTLKVYRPNELRVCDAVALTLNPYYPGLTGRPEACRDAVGDPSLYNKTPASLEKDDVARVLEALLKVMETVVDEVDAREYLSGLVVLRNTVLQDPRQALDALLHAAEARGSYAGLLAAVIDPEIEYPPARASLEEVARHAPRLEGVRPRRLRGPGWLKIYTVEEAGALTPTLAWRVLRSVGAIDGESLIAFRAGDAYVVSPFQAEEALGPGAVRRLVETHTASQEGFWLRLSGLKPE